MYVHDYCTVVLLNVFEDKRSSDEISVKTDKLVVECGAYEIMHPVFSRLVTICRSRTDY